MKIFKEYRQDWTFLLPPSLDEFVGMDFLSRLKQYSSFPICQFGYHYFPHLNYSRRLAQTNKEAGYA